MVLLLHGFPDHARSWRHQMPALAASGYRAVAITMPGYEPSNMREDGNYTQEAVAEDIVALIDALGVESVHLVGHDWGAAVAYRVANMTPHRIRSLATLSVPHPGRFLMGIAGTPRQLGMSWYMFFFQLRGFAEVLSKHNDYAFIRWLWRRWSPDWVIPEDEIEKVIDTLRQPKVFKSALGYYRAALGLRALVRPIAEKLFLVPVRTLAMIGADDGCIDARTFQNFLRGEEFPAGLRIEVIPNAGHFVQQEQPEQVNALLIDWLRGSK